MSVFDLLLNAGTFCITYSVLYCCRNLIFYVISGSSFLSLASLLYVDYVLLVAIILHQLLFTNPVFPTVPRKIPCVFPVKVTYKTSTKKSAKTKTKKLTYTLKVAKVGVTLSGDSVVAIGSTTKLTNTKKNSSRAKITYTSSDDSIATVAADGTVTGVKAGKATITAKITVGKDSAETTKDVEVKNYVLKSVAQNKTNELVATIDGATKNIKASEVTIKTPDNVVLPVKSVSVDSKDATKVTLTTFSDMNDGKEYTVTLDGTTVNFVATDNKVASINIDKPTIPVKTETEIKLVAKDANGVILKELPYGTSDVNYDFSLTTANGYVNESKLYLNKVGDTATAEITYKTNKYTADGKADGNIGPNKLTITATDQAAVSSFKVRIGDANKKFSSLKDNDKIAVDETSAVWAYFEIKDTDGKEISNGKILKFIKIQNGDEICILRKEGEWDEYPSISKKDLKTITKGKKIRYLKDRKNIINKYNLAYDLQYGQKKYMPIKQMKKIEMLNNVKNIGLIILMTMLSISMIGLTIYLYWLADTKDMYIYN